jgi:hypothetical protein
MDRAEFVRIAPDYYLAAIALGLRNVWGHFSLDALSAMYTSTNDDETIWYLSNTDLVERGIDKLFKAGAISKLEDAFGETLYQKTDMFDAAVDTLKLDASGPYYKSELANDGGRWIRGALHKLNQLYLELGITPADFEVQAPDQWAPITIDQNEQSVKKVIQDLQAATDAIEQDNGYAVSHPEERDQVVYDLKGGLEKFKSDKVSVAWIKRTVEALKLASGRFANTIKGQAIDGALSAIKDFVKSHISSALEHFWSLFS